jgi:hypothetical protein
MMRDAPLLARYAESLFWMARYLERVENIARLIDVTQTFESPGRESESWFALVRINADEAGFAKRGLRPTADDVKRYYLLDRENLTGVPASLEAARMNARTLRPLISTEMWMQLNVFHRDMTSIPEHELHGDQLSRLCVRIKEGVQAHTGITEGTFFRDQGWYFYQLGRLIERADQITRLLDIRYHLLVPPFGADPVGRGAARGGRLPRVPKGGAARLHAGGRRRVSADRYVVSTQRRIVRRADRGVPHAVAQPLRAARHGGGAGAGGGTARRHPGPPGGGDHRGRAAPVPGRCATRPQRDGGRNRHGILPRLAPPRGRTSSRNPDHDAIPEPSRDSVTPNAGRR